MPDSLFDPLTIRGTEVPNRLMMSPMCQYSAPEGRATDWHRVHLGSRAVGGAGIVCAEATAVSPEARISPHDLGIWTDEQADALAPVAGFVREQGAIPAIQLAHAGRKSSTRRPWEGGGRVPPSEGGWEAVGPSGVPYPRDGDTVPVRRLSEAGIERVIDDFVAAAERALEAGFEVVEIHAAHGYLLHEFLSPVTNRRSDDYGGGFEGRTRLLRELATAVRDAWPEDRPLFVRISATDWLPDRESWTVDDSVRLAGRLADCGVDLVDVSSGGIAPDSYPEYRGPNYQLRLAERIRRGAEGIAVGTVGGITTPEQAQAVVANDRADLAIVGRELLRDPYFGLRAAEALGADEVRGPPQYRGAFGR